MGLAFRDLLQCKFSHLQAHKYKKKNNLNKMGDAATAKSSLNILKERLIKALPENGIDSEVKEIIITEPKELQGEHFATETVYAEVQFKDESIRPLNLFVKKYSSNEMHTDMVKKMKVMPKEASFFKDILPLLRNFCSKFPGCENLLDFFPKLFYGDEDFVVLENVVLDKGYVMLDKDVFQDYETATLVLTNLAKYHAANFALIEEMGRDVFQEKYALNIFEAFDFNDTSLMTGMFDNGIMTCIKIITENPTPGSTEVIQILESYFGKIVPEMAELLKIDATKPLMVLNHGDCWNNNMLFKFDPETGDLLHHLLVDLQITRYGTPCLDLGHYIQTSVKPAVRAEHYKDLLKTYYDTFVVTSKLLNSNCPITFEELLIDYKKHTKVGYYFSLSMQSAIGAFKDVDMNLMGSETEPEKIMALYNNIIQNWIQANPDIAAGISKRLVAFVLENDKLQKGMIF